MFRFFTLSPKLCLYTCKSRWTKDVFSLFQAFHDQIITGCSFSAPPHSIFLIKSFEQQVQVTQQEFVVVCVKDEVVLYVFNKCMSPEDKNFIARLQPRIAAPRWKVGPVGGQKAKDGRSSRQPRIMALLQQEQLPRGAAQS